MHPFHHAALAEGVLTANPGDPAQHRQQNGDGRHEQNAQYRQVKHGKGQRGQRRRNQRQSAEEIEHGVGHPAAVILAVGTDFKPLLCLGDTFEHLNNFLSVCNLNDF